MFDDKNLQVGDDIELLNEETEKRVAVATITSIQEKTLSEINNDDFEGHNTYKDQETMLKDYKSYYGDNVTFDIKIK